MKHALAFVLWLLSLPAFAGDASDLRILGFSPDGAVFAFEETGIQDGSGFPYANRFYINTASDSFLPGTPVRIRIEDETATLDAVRAQARAKGEAASGLADATLAANPGTLLAYAPLTEAGDPPIRMAFHDSTAVATFRKPRELQLTVLTEAPAENCYGMADKQAFFALDLVEASPDAVPLRLHEDASVPKSRNCPTDYRLGGVVRFAGKSANVLVSLIIVQSIGFEGPDHRWLAVAKPDQSSDGQP
jgi:predicted secreted protein